MCCLFIFFYEFPVRMYAWTFLLFYLLGNNCQATREADETYYECGRHGRFEYCIDGIPGCVVGCHCHPGYYFDTNSKICEPNIKLTKDYRRNFVHEPTRLPIMPYTPIDNNPSSTSTNEIEQRVDAIANDTDNLGDWLYNQFFKTIENQVINSTDDEKMTRRSGSGPVVTPFAKNLRRSRKRHKSKSKKKKHRKKGLKKKLLRITDDDSLFDSSSSSSSSETSSSDSSSDSERTSIEEDTEHGHRKIIMVNKRPTPPLPSFIFLPNVETPFYPPIGLPPPPILPMYPMVPVPPVGAFFPGHLHCNDSETTSAPTTTSTTVAVTTTVTTPVTSTIAVEDPVQPNVRSSDSFNEANKKPHKSNKHGERNKFMQKLRQKMKRQNKMHPPFVDSFQNPEVPYFNDRDPPGPFPLHPRDMYDPVAPMEDVDFKYLSQLIHKIDLNKTKPGLPFKLNKQRMVDIPNQPFRRNNPNSPVLQPSPSLLKMRPASKADDINDSYYSNLGKQISSLIRKIDEDGERQINIEIEQQNQDPMHTLFNENRYAPRSYWERFVRSPLKPVRREQNYVEEIEHLKKSNEDLFNLEDQVNVAAAVERSLTLQELENIANIMERTQLQNRRKSSIHVTPKSNSHSYNINLLPRLNRRGYRVNNQITNSKKDQGITKPVFKENSNRNIVHTLHPNIYPKHTSQIPSPYVNETHNNVSIPFRKRTKLDFINDIFQSPRNTPHHHQLPRIFHKNITTPKPPPMFKYQASPVILNYRSVRYFDNNHNQYHVQNSVVPFQLPFLSKPSIKVPGRNSNPSYFHNELHHFDYFN